MQLLEHAYYFGLSIKKYYTLKHRRRLPYRVISIGNITVGGTGKTPATIAVAEEAKKRGMLPVILTRGYKGRAKGPCFVTTGDRPLLTVDEAGDEPVLIAERLKGVPVVKGSNRYAAGIFSLSRLGLLPSGLGPQIIFILDDGFQHWGLFRDKDILLIDAGNPFGSYKLLPSGRLREPISSISRADIIVLTHTESCASNSTPERENIVKEIRHVNPSAPIFSAEHIPSSCRLKNGEQKPPAWVCGKNVFAFCALGNPESFRATLQSLHADLVGFRAFPDHYKYRAGDILSIQHEAKKLGAVWIVTTEKDIIKIRHLDLPDNIFIIEIELLFADNFFSEVFTS